MAEYDSWALADLRAEVTKRYIPFSSKDGVKTLASKLRLHDKVMGQKDSDAEEEEEHIQKCNSGGAGKCP